MGLPGMGGMEPEWLEAVALWESTLAKHNQAASGFALGTPEAKAYLSRGKSFLMIAADVFTIVGKGCQDLAEARVDYKKQNHNGIYQQL